VLGVQANAWTEHMRSFERVQHAAFPRVAALAELGWSPASKLGYADFRARLPAQFERYRRLGIHYAQTPVTVRIQATGSHRDAQASVELSTPLGLGEIRYRTDGQAPDAGSPRA